LFAENVVVTAFFERFIDGETDIRQGIEKGPIEIKKQRFRAHDEYFSTKRTACLW
jgi:hypothetical protein